jgi:putrescine oxidase
MSTSSDRPVLETDVVVIGAGATGLSAANRLRDLGLEVVVLEARDRVGGRLWTDHVDGAMLELGGQWVSPDQTALIETVEELGLETYTRYREGADVYVDADGTRTTFEGDALPLPAESAAEVDRLTDVIEGLVSQHDVDAPWAHPQARELDQQTFRAWLESQSDDAVARENVALFIGAAMLTKPTHAFSALEAVHMAASAGSFAHLLDADFILDRRVVGGLQQVPLRLAERLGDRVHLDQPVRDLHRDADGVTAVTDTQQVRARRAIVTVPPSVYTAIRHHPPLPRLKQQLQQQLSLGLVIKVHAVYATPFWRDAGLSGTAFSPYLDVHEAYDNTNHDEDRGFLVGFVSDERADELLRLPADERRARVLASLAEYYGPQALEPVIYHESDWASEEWTRGAYAASHGVGGRTRYRDLQDRPDDGVHWASSDLAGEGFQHVDGALRIGRRTADTVAQALQESATR